MILFEIVFIEINLLFSLGDGMDGKTLLDKIRKKLFEYLKAMEYGEHFRIF